MWLTSTWMSFLSTLRSCSVAVHSAQPGPTRWRESSGVSEPAEVCRVLASTNCVKSLV